MKIVRGSKYFAVEAIDDVPQELKQLYLDSIKKYNINFKHNLIKISEDKNSISLMYYPHLDSNPHPYLENSMSISLVDNTIKSKKESAENPVILHRLELMLSKNNPRNKELEKLTVIEEQKGLYDEKHMLYLGRRKYWNMICREANLPESLSPEMENKQQHQQLDLFNMDEIPIKIKRETTAMHIQRASFPTRWAEEKKIIKSTVVDWGCGRGRDTNWLISLNYDVLSYDPFFKPSPSPQEIDFSSVNTVLLNYVLNVIESDNERRTLLNDIYSYVYNGTILIVSARSEEEISSFASKSNWKRFNDGFLTSKKTFQKGYTLDELCESLIFMGKIVDKIEFEGGVVCVIQIAK